MAPSRGQDDGHFNCSQFASQEMGFGSAHDDYVSAYVDL
jgi:hypothetical protein